MAQDLGNGIFQYGQQLVFGIDDTDLEAFAASIGLLIEKANIKRVREFKQTRKGTRGITVSKTVGPYMLQGSFEGSVINITLLAASGANFPYRGELFIIDEIDESSTNDDYMTVTVTAEAFPEITSIEGI